MRLNACSIWLNSLVFENCCIRYSVFPFNISCIAQEIWFMGTIKTCLNKSMKIGRSTKSKMDEYKISLSLTDILPAMLFVGRKSSSLASTCEKFSSSIVYRDILSLPTVFSEKKICLSLPGSLTASISCISMLLRNCSHSSSS